MFNEAYSSGKVPIQWQTALITPIFKHGDASDPANYRPIAVGEPLCRLYANILNHRLTQYTEHQQLRTHNKLDIDLTSGVHQAFVLQHVIDKQKYAHEPLYLCFVDLKAAYDKVQWPLIWQVLQRLGIHGSMLTAIQSLYTDCSLAMKTNGFHGDMHSPSVGLRQGRPLSATVFGLFLDGLHHHLQVSVPDAGIKIQHTRLTDMEYADDVFLLAHCPSHLQALITALADYCQQLHMQISIAKTKVMIIGDGTQATFTCHHQPLEEVESFEYLGLLFHQSGHISHLITPKLNKAAASIVQQKHAQLQCSDTVCLKFRSFNPFSPLLFTMVALFGVCIVPQIPLPTTFANS